jgi:high-affinity nickel permease
MASIDNALLATLILGFVLGLRHALDADHVVAVSTMVSQYRSPLKAAVVGAFWGIGHTGTLLLVGVAVIVFKLAIPPRLASGMEFLVGVMLFVLGIQNLWRYRSERHTHLHQHGEVVHTHEHLHQPSGEQAQHHPLPQHRSLFLGMVHGLAGSAALMLLVLGTIQSPAEGLGYILIFGVGSIVGMMLISTLIGLPFALSSRRFAAFNDRIRLLTGALSVAFGIFVMVQIGLIEGLF